MDDRVVALKLKIFDILEQQEQLNIKARQLESMKRPLVDELNKLRQERKPEPAE